MQNWCGLRKFFRLIFDPPQQGVALLRREFGCEGMRASARDGRAEEAAARKRKPRRPQTVWVLKLVEVAGIEPASEVIFSSDLHV